MRALTAITLATLLLTGCTDETADRGESLTLDTIEDRALAGAYDRAGDELVFTSVEVETDVFDVVIEVNGMTLAAIVDRGAQVAEIDGFAASGEDTQMLDADREVLGSFVRALAAEFDLDSMTAAAILYRVASHWAQTPDSMPLQRLVAGEQDRGWTSLCGYYRQWVDATHDGNVCGNWSPYCTTTAEVGARYSVTYTDTGSGWTTTLPDHAYYPYQTGECYGNCGAGCPGGNQTLTLDCHDHDQCVRNGHFIASFWCNDEFTAASDDEFFAPTCSGT